MPESTSNAPLIYIIPETERVFPGQRHPGTYAGDRLSAVKPCAFGEARYHLLCHCVIKHAFLEARYSPCWWRYIHTLGIAT